MVSFQNFLLETCQTRPLFNLIFQARVDVSLRNWRNIWLRNMSLSQHCNSWHNVWKYFHHPQVSCALHLLLPQMPDTSNSLMILPRKRRQVLEIEDVTENETVSKLKSLISRDLQDVFLRYRVCWLVMHQSFPLFLTDNSTKWLKTSLSIWRGKLELKMKVAVDTRLLPGCHCEKRWVFPLVSKGRTCTNNVTGSWDRLVKMYCCWNVKLKEKDHGPLRH